MTITVRPHWLRWRWPARVLAIPGALAATGLWLLAPPGSRLEAEPQQAPVPAPAVACQACHPKETASWAASLHRRTVGAPQLAESHQGCAACHPGTEEHLANLGDESKRPRVPGTRGMGVASTCQECHRGGKQSMWALSAHARGEDACLTCHDPHGGKGEQMLKREEPELCATCHPGPVAEGRLPSHHPIAEGKMTCTDCHNVHGDARGNLTEVTTGEMCFKCHAEKSGPFQAEHPPVTEDCSICHRPHGSAVDNLLVADQPVLCLQCHTGHSDGHRTPIVSLTPNDPQALNAINGFYGRCTSCHSRIHGTDLLSGTGNPTFMPGSPLGGGSVGSGRGMGASATEESLWGFSDIELGRLSESGNPAYVREYDGRNFEMLNAGLSLTRYDKDSDLRIQVIDLPIGDQDLKLRYGTPRLDVRAGISGLTHRLGRYDDFTDATIPGGGGGTARVNTTDLTSGKNDFHLDRTVIDLAVAARCPKVPQAKLLFNMWQEREHGSKQFLFLDRCTSCHKLQTAEPIDRVTTITEGGVQVDLPKASLRFLHGQQEFSNEAPEGFFTFTGVFGLFGGSAPLFAVPHTQTVTNDLRGAAALSSRTTLAGLWRSKHRTDELGRGEVDLRGMGGGASYALSRDLVLQGSRFSYRQEVTGIEEGVSRDRDKSRVDLRYSGIRHANLSLGVAKETVDRDSEREFVPGKSDSTTWSSALTYTPLSQVWLQVRYRNIQTDNSDFFDPASPPAHFPSRLSGLPDDGSLLSAVLGYTVNPNTYLSGLYSRRRDRYEVNASALDIARSDEEKNTTQGVQVQHSRGRSHLGVGYYHQTGHTLTDATYGTDSFTLSPPLSTQDTVFAPIESQALFDYRSNILALDGAWWMTGKLRLFGSYNLTTSKGQVTAFDLGDYVDQNPDLNGVAVTLNPFDIDIRDRWLGASYVLEPDTEVVLSHQRRSWTDAASPTHNGSYGLWRVGLRRQF